MRFNFTLSLLDKILTKSPESIKMIPPVKKFLLSSHIKIIVITYINT